MNIKFEWDEDKNLRNQLKHGVSFDLAQHVFDDPFAFLSQDRHENGEERWQTIGIVGGIVVLLVAHTVTMADGTEIIRIISARRADKNERNRYDKQTY
ncbi:MAG: BrnT family toxin [Gallionellaceae bacterium]